MAQQPLVPLGNAWLAPYGANWYPVRALLTALKGSDETRGSLRLDRGNNALTWDGRLLPVPVLLREGSARAPVRQLANAFYWAIAVDGADRRILLKKSDG